MRGLFALLLLASSLNVFASYSAKELEVCSKKSTLAAINNGSTSLANLCSYYCENTDAIEVKKLVRRLSPSESNTFDEVCEATVDL